MKPFIAIFALVSFLSLAVPRHASATSTLPLVVRITPAGQAFGDLKVMHSDGEETLANHVWKYWLFNGDQTLLWAGSDGAGGYENEGQSLWRYDAGTKRKRKLGAFVYMIDTVREARSRSGKLGFILSMSDGGLGAPHLAVVRDGGGIAWQKSVARLAAIRNGRIAVAVLRTRDIEAAEPSAKIPVRRMMYRDLDRLLR